MATRNNKQKIILIKKTRFKSAIKTLDLRCFYAFLVTFELSHLIIMLCCLEIFGEFGQVLFWHILKDFKVF